MEPRKFAIGDRVRLRLDNHVNGNPADIYEVSRVMPAGVQVWEYRVKRLADGQQRAVGEPQLIGTELPEIAARPEIKAAG
jgi:hypothetical protein